MPALRPPLAVGRLRVNANGNQVEGIGTQGEEDWSAGGAPKSKAFSLSALGQQRDGGPRSLSSGARKLKPPQASPQAESAQGAAAVGQAAGVASGKEVQQEGLQPKGVGGEAAGSAEADLCELLAAQLGAAQEALATQHELALSLAAKRWEAMRRAESRLVALEKENALLHNLCATSPNEGAATSTAEAGEVSRHGDTILAEAAGLVGEENLLEAPKPPEVDSVRPPSRGAPGLVLEEPQSLHPFGLEGTAYGSEMMGDTNEDGEGASQAGSEGSTRSAGLPKVPRARHCFKMHESWVQKDEEIDLVTSFKQKSNHNAKGSAFRPKNRGMTSQALAELREAQDEGVGQGGVSCKNGVLGPNSKLRGAWDFGSLLFVLYDVAVIPLQLLDMPKSGVLQTLGMITRLFWTADMPLSFNTGFVRPNGSVEMSRREIAIRYFKTWFLVDVLILIVDWLDMAGNESGGNWTGLGKASRGFRLIRMIRLIRVVRINKRLESLMEYVNSERLLIVVDIVKNMFLILGASHFIACVWASIDTSELSWRITNGYAGADIYPLYLMSFHWAVAQFSGGMDEVTPGTELERIFAVGVLLIAFIAASIFVSSITSSMTQLTIINSQESQQLSILKKYLAQVGATKGLSTRLMNNAQHMLEQRQRNMDENKIEILRMTSEPLRVELHFEIYSQPLSTHPFFRLYMEDSPNVVRRVCHRAMRMCVVSRGDSLFVAGEIPANPSMYIVCRGELTYTCLSGNTQYVSISDWVSEATLWLSNWRHMGELVADIECCLCILDAEQFRSIATSFQTLSRLDPRSYASHFVEAINACELEQISDLRLNSSTLYDRYSRRRTTISHVSHHVSHVRSVFQRSMFTSFMA